MANILDEQERKRKELAAQGIRTRGVAGAQGGPAEMTYKPLEQRTGAEAKALGVSPQMQGQIAQEQGLIPPAAQPTPAVTPSQAPAPQARGVAPQAAGVTPQAQAANQQLETARAGMGANRAKSSKRLTDMAAQVDPQIRADANSRREWRMMTPQQRKEHIGLKKLEMDARSAEDAVAGASWEDIDKMSRSFADATGTAMDSYGNSFYTPDQQMFIREQRRNIDRAASEMFSNADRSAWRSPQDMYQAIASLPEVQQAGPFGQAYAFNIMRRFASPQMRAQMEAEDRNQGLFTEWMVSRGADEIASAQDQAGGFRFTNDGTGDIATQIFLNRDKDLASGQIWRQFLAETPQIYTAIDGKVQIDSAHGARFNETMRQKENAEQRTYADAQAKQKQAEQVGQRVSAARETVARREQATGELGRWVVNEQDGSIDDLKQYAEKQTKDLTEREKVAATGELMAQKASYAPLLEYAKYDEAGINAAIEQAVAGMDPTQAPAIRAQMMQSWQYAQSMGGAEGLQNYLNRIDYLISEYSGEKKDKPTSFGFLPDVVDNGDPPVVDVDKETDAILKRVGLSVSSREGQLYALYDALQDMSKTLEENKEQYAYWRSGKGGGFAPGGERRAAFAEKYFNKYAVNGRLPKNIIDEMMAIDKKVQERMNQSGGK